MHCRVCTNPDVRVTDRIKSPNCSEPVPVCFCRACGHYSLFPIQYLQQKSFEWEGIDYYLADADRRNQVAHRVISALCKSFEQANGKPAKNILDAGCAVGLALGVAADMGLEAVGIEPERRLAEYGRSNLGVDIRTGMLGQVETGQESFDLIFCEQVLEHVEDPLQFLITLKGLLKPDGQLYIGVPPVCPLNRLTTFMIRRLKFPLPVSVLTNIFHDPDEHINVFSRQSIEQLAVACDLEIRVLPLSLSGLNSRRLLKHLLCLGASPGTFILSYKIGD